uniref:Uncharacterized protein n=1 Tax=Anguilla anguilla TaxID=7936 RepID=A0A0E9SMU6_ANGAN
MCVWMTSMCDSGKEPSCKSRINRPTLQTRSGILGSVPS